MAHIRISRTLFLATLVGSLMLLAPATASARGGSFHGGGFRGGGFGFYPGFYGGLYGPVYPYGFWGGYYGDPYAWGPYGYPYPGGYYGGHSLGEVRIKTPERDAEIYINGSFAGRAHDLKRFYLAPGKYRIEQRIGSDVQKQRIYVLPDRSVKLEFGKVGTPSPQPAPEAAPPPDSKTAPPPPDSKAVPPPEGGY